MAVGVRRSALCKECNNARQRETSLYSRLACLHRTSLVAVVARGNSAEQTGCKSDWLRHDWPAFIARTTILGFRALLGTRLGVRVTTRRAASHRPRGTRCARGHAAFSGTSGRLGLYPVA